MWTAEMVGTRERLWRPVLSPVVVMKARFLSRYRFPWRWVAPRSCARTRGGAAVYILRMLIQERGYFAPSVTPMAVGSLLQNRSSFSKSAFRMMDRSSLVPVSLCRNARRYPCICSFVFRNQKTSRYFYEDVVYHSISDCFQQFVWTIVW